MRTRSGREATDQSALSEERSTASDHSSSPLRSRSKKRRIDEVGAPSLDDIQDAEPQVEDSPAKHTRRSRFDSGNKAAGQKAVVNFPELPSPSRASNKRAPKKEAAPIQEPVVVTNEEYGYLASELNVNIQLNSNPAADIRAVQTQVKEESSGNLIRTVCFLLDV